MIIESIYVTKLIGTKGQKIRELANKSKGA